MINRRHFEKLAKYGFEKVLVNDMDFAFVAITVARKGCGCALCDKGIEKGEKRVSTITSKDTKHAHEKCVKALWGDEETIDCDSQQTNYNASTTINHGVVVRASKWLAVAFTELGFKVTSCSPTHKDYVLDKELNRHRSGHLIPTFLKNGFKTFVNSVVIKSWEEFDKLTRR